MSEQPIEQPIEQRLELAGGGFVRVRGRFFRAVGTEHRADALTGSRSAGRYSRTGQPTLYLSASRAGVAAAMIAHRAARSAALELVEIAVDARGIVDLRDPATGAHFGIDLAEAAAPWQEAVRDGADAPSWRVRDRLEVLGVRGLIDPSRQRPGLWHLVLFHWDAEVARLVA